MIPQILLARQLCLLLCRPVATTWDM